MTDRPIRIQRKRTKGWRLPDNTVIVDRTSIFGNPFVVGESGVPDRETAVARYRQWLIEGRAIERHRILANLHQLRGKNLACWCPLDQACHGDVLLEMANDLKRKEGKS